MTKSHYINQKVFYYCYFIPYVYLGKILNIITDGLSFWCSQCLKKCYIHPFIWHCRVSLSQTKKFLVLWALEQRNSLRGTSQNTQSRTNFEKFISQFGPIGYQTRDLLFQRRHRHKPNITQKKTLITLIFLLSINRVVQFIKTPCMTTFVLYCPQWVYIPLVSVNRNFCCSCVRLSIVYRRKTRVFNINN